MIFLDTNVVCETLSKRPDDRVLDWLERHADQCALPTVTIAEIAYGIRRLQPEQRAVRLELGLGRWRRRLADRIFGLTEDAAVAYGEIMGSAARRGRAMSTADGMIAAIAKVNGGRLATRNLKDFETAGLNLVSPWAS